MLNGAVTKWGGGVALWVAWSRRMTDPAAPPSPPRRAGGALLAAGILGGVVIGSVLGQPSIGFLAGLGIGLAAVALVWAGDRKRR